jgi:hypothetical protein
MMTTAETHVLLSDARRRMTARDAAIVRVQVAVSEIAAPTGEEQRRAAWIARRFTSLGLPISGQMRPAT